MLGISGHKTEVFGPLLRSLWSDLAKKIYRVTLFPSQPFAKFRPNPSSFSGDIRSNVLQASDWLQYQREACTQASQTSRTRDCNLQQQVIDNALRRKVLSIRPYKNSTFTSGGRQKRQTGTKISRSTYWLVCEFSSTIQTTEYMLPWCT